MTDKEPTKNNSLDDSIYEGRDANFMDIDRMVNEGLGGGQVTLGNGLIDDSTTDTMDGRESDVD
ncbi:hypothetical protein [Paenibacillus contaminans]|uniref:Uncharacterized protein n=1 Tax=Paenibacillus contaminans TaxID=450362 RepID=A0A329MLT2_9BACL|nr:hypothetical protein [Paenibacillus contaminans]RAV20256.1 hypothetical protein DQG23_17495 [Paenibacillus contaminans]